MPPSRQSSSGGPVRRGLTRSRCAASIPKPSTSQLLRSASQSGETCAARTWGRSEWYGAIRGARFRRSAASSRSAESASRDSRMPTSRRAGSWGRPASPSWTVPTSPRIRWTLSCRPSSSDHCTSTEFNAEAHAHLTNVDRDGTVPLKDSAMISYPWSGTVSAVCFAVHGGPANVAIG